MWLARELAKLVLRILVAIVISLAIAGLLAAFSSHSFADAARVLCIVFGCGLLAMAGVGRGSNLDRYLDQNVTKTAWGTIPGVGVLKSRPEDPVLSAGAVFFCSGLALLVVGIVLF